MRPIALVLGALLLALAGGHARAAGPWMTLTSTSFQDGARIPTRFGADDPKRACSPRDPAICPCPGKNVSPQLRWTNAPAGTKSFAILMYDIDGQYGAGVSHWIAYDIPPGVHALAEGEATAGSKNFVGGTGTRNNTLYIGPCPPQGDGPHHYLITLLATDLEPKLPAGLNREQLFAALKTHLLASATIGGLFARQY